jgi:predicted enzyme related to lactoylglutathione lyase
MGPLSDMPLDHVALTIHDHERSAAFYAEHFGFTERLHADDRAAGVEETAWQDDGRFVRVQVADPDGYRVEFYAF